jgi:hypothetical protein
LTTQARDGTRRLEQHASEAKSPYRHFALGEVFGPKPPAKPQQEVDGKDYQSVYVYHLVIVPLALERERAITVARFSI